MSARKVHKADREKLRRDRLNEQFAELAGVLDPDRPKNDKATILIDSLQAVKELHSEIKRLRDEHASLVVESQDITREKEDLKEEREALKAQTLQLEFHLQQCLQAISPLIQRNVDATADTMDAPTGISNSLSDYSHHANPSEHAGFSRTRRPFFPCPVPSYSSIERPAPRYPSPSQPLPDYLVQILSGQESQVPVQTSQNFVAPRADSSFVSLSSMSDTAALKDLACRKDNKSLQLLLHKEDGVDIQLSLGNSNSRRQTS